MADQASGNDDRKRIPGPACSDCRLLELTHASLGSAVLGMILPVISSLLRGRSHKQSAKILEGPSNSC